MDDYKSTGSVLEKLSLFEKLEQRQASAVGTINSLTKQNSTTSTGSSNDSPSCGRRNDDLTKSIRSNNEKDPGMHFPIHQTVIK